jgi:quercetin dioxygenase-like cupin family protein
MSDTPDAERLRESPRERFGSAENMFDMAGALRKLRGEASPERAGHKQITLDQYGPVTVVLFAFDEGGSLKDHKAAGVVTIQALEGDLTVRTDTQEYKLGPKMMVMLSPNVRHSLDANTACAVLLTVCLVNSADHR